MTDRVEYLFDDLNRQEMVKRLNRLYLAPCAVKPNRKQCPGCFGEGFTTRLSWGGLYGFSVLAVDCSLCGGEGFVK